MYLALLRAGLLNCVFMWASFRVFDPLPTVRQIQCNPTLSPIDAHIRVHNEPTIRVANRASRCKGWLKSMRDDFGKNDTVQRRKPRNVSYE